MDQLDAKINGDESIANQKKKIDEQRSRNYATRKAKMKKLKEEWKANQSTQEQPLDP